MKTPETAAGADDDGLGNALHLEAGNRTGVATGDAGRNIDAAAGIPGLRAHAAPVEIRVRGSGEIGRTWARASVRPRHRLVKRGDPAASRTGARVNSRSGVALAFAACVALALALVGHDLSQPGLYYDEVIQATPALDFVRGEGGPGHIPGARAIRLFGGWWPVMTQPYMGAIKSQLLIPTLATFGADAAVLRLTTLGWALAGLGLAMFWARRVFGGAVAVVMGLLVAVDPSVLFVARHDWGSFSLALLFRGGALLLLTRGWQQRSAARLFAGGLCAGLGVYNKIDFVVFGAAAVAALVVACPQLRTEWWRRRRGPGFAAIAGAAVGASPMLMLAGGALAATRFVSRGRTIDPGDWPEKLAAATTVLDGSYFHRLMLAGGSFEGMSAVEGAVGTPQLALLVGATAVLAVLIARDARRGGADRAMVFALAATSLTLIGVFLTPRAVRIHHFLNVTPFAQLLVALALVELWRRAAGLSQMARPALRAACAAALLVAVAGGVRANLATLATIRETGGRGRWTEEIGRLALAHEPSAPLVCLDWGFGEPMRFTTPGLAPAEPFWNLRRGAGPTVLDAGVGAVYLAWEEPYGVFPIGAGILAALEGLPEGSVEVRRTTDRTGDPAFVSLRFKRPHRLVYREGRLEVEIR